MRRLWMSAAFLSLFVVVSNPHGASASTVFLDEPFGSSWTAGSDWIVASGGTFTPVIATESGTPAQALRLTPATTNQASALIFARPQPMSQGLDVSFHLSQWGGTGADGIAFFLQKGTETSRSPGSLGGALGYSTEPGHNPPKPGLPSGLLGVGFDLFGNFNNSAFGGTNCPSSSAIASSLVIRGPGSGFTGYCRLGTATNSDTLWGSGTSTREDRAKSVRIIIDPSTASTPQVKVWVCGRGARCNTSTTPTLAVNAPAELLAEPTVRFGFAAGTGGDTNNHEIWNLQVASQSVFPAAAITTTSLTSGTVGTSYNSTVNATGVTPITFAVTSGSLPAGLTLNTTTGAITGTPTTSGTFSFTVEATDSRVANQSGRVATQAYTLTIAATTTTTAAPTTTTTVAATTTVPPSTTTTVAGDVSAANELPTTGSETNTLSAIILVLVAGGAYLRLLLSRRPRHES